MWGGLPQTSVDKNAFIESTDGHLFPWKHDWIVDDKFVLLENLLGSRKKLGTINVTALRKMHTSTCIISFCRISESFLLCFSLGHITNLPGLLQDGTVPLKCPFVWHVMLAFPCNINPGWQTWETAVPQGKGPKAGILVALPAKPGSAHVVTEERIDLQLPFLYHWVLWDSGPHSNTKAICHWVVPSQCGASPVVRQVATPPPVWQSLQTYVTWDPTA